MGQPRIPSLNFVQFPVGAQGSDSDKVVRDRLWKLVRGVSKLRPASGLYTDGMLRMAHLVLPFSDAGQGCVCSVTG